MSASLQCGTVIRGGSAERALTLRAEIGSLSVTDAGWSSLVARRAHNPKVAGSNPAPAIAADQGVGLARALQTGRPGPRGPSVRAAFVVGGVPISYQFSGEAPPPRASTLPRHPQATHGDALTPRLGACSMWASGVRGAD